MAHQLECCVLVSLATGCKKKRSRSWRGEIDHGLGRMLAALARDLGDRPVRAFDVVEDRSQS